MKESSVDDFDVLFVKKRSGRKIFIIIFGMVILALISVYTYLSIGVVRDRMSVAQIQAEGTPQINPSLLNLLKEV